MRDYAAMTVNERLSAAGLMDAFEAARTTGDSEHINVILRQVGLRRGENGMNWSLNAQD
ncbi:hypothetical protein [Sphingomonas japonica]|uniref:hypothetical protein n=2 Tax=Sphingomonas japonica TaxID=511662 RepID=UPI0031D32B53